MSNYRLKSGVFVHFHDIYFPYDYSRTLLSFDLFFWGESTLLHAFLIGNSHCRIVLSTSMLHYAAPERIAALFPRYAPQHNADGLQKDGGEHFPSATVSPYDMSRCSSVDRVHSDKYARDPQMNEPCLSG